MCESYLRAISGKGTVVWQLKSLETSVETGPRSRVLSIVLKLNYLPNRTEGCFLRHLCNILCMDNNNIDLSICTMIYIIIYLSSNNNNEGIIIIYMYIYIYIYILIFI